MKRIGLIVLLGLIGLMGNVQAQFGDYGVKVGLGWSSLEDDLASDSPVLSASIGGYINYTFAESESVLAEIFYLQSGLNIVRKGSNFAEHRENGNNIMARTGYYHPWYAQIPILACVHFELPIRQEGHSVNAFLGPAISIGLFGGYGDRKITPGVPSPSANYDVNFNGSAADRAVFNHIKRIDVSAIAGLSYEYGDFTVSLYVDRGFIPTSSGDDILRIIETQQGGGSTASDVNVKIPNGYNMSYMLSVSYRLGKIVNNK